MEYVPSNWFQLFTYTASKLKNTLQQPYEKDKVIIPTL